MPCRFQPRPHLIKSTQLVKSNKEERNQRLNNTYGVGIVDLTALRDVSGKCVTTSCLELLVRKWTMCIPRSTC